MNDQQQTNEAADGQSELTDGLGVWRPIETAPGDDKSDYFFAIVAWGPENDKTTGYAVRFKGEWFAGTLFYNGARYDERQFSFREHPVRPSHWVPIPEAPNT